MYRNEAQCILKEMCYEVEEKDKEATVTELEKIEESEESTMRTLRIFLRNIVTRLAQDKRFKEFTKPVDLEEVPDYQKVVEHPMDLSTIMCNIDSHQYQTVKDMLEGLGHTNTQQPHNCDSFEKSEKKFQGSLPYKIYVTRLGLQCTSRFGV